MAKPTSPHKNVEHYDRLVATHPEIERKGAAMPYTSMNGNMFSFLSRDGLMALRLSHPDRVAFLKQYATRIFEDHGAVMAEYVTVPPALLKNTHELEPFFARSISYATSLKPKPAAQPVKSEAKKVSVVKGDTKKGLEAKKEPVQKKPAKSETKIAKKAKQMPAKKTVKKSAKKKVTKKVAKKMPTKKKVSNKRK